MPPKKWPYPGDSPVARARKMALAYRSIAQEQQALIRQCALLLDKVDRRLVAFSDPETAGAIDGLMTAIARVSGSTGVDTLDLKFREWGEQWHADVAVTYDEDDYISANDAAPLLNISAGSIGRLRIDGRIKGKWDPALGSRGGWTFRVGDLWELSTKLRGRNWRTKDTTDSISDNGRSDPECKTK